MAFTFAHPLANEASWLESETEVTRLGLTQGRQQLLRQERPVVFIGPADARLTFPLLVGLRRHGSDWLIRVDGRGLWSPSRGRWLDSPGDVFMSTPPMIQSAAPNAVQILVSVHHGAAAETRLGRSVEALAAIAYSVPQRWGVNESATVAWDRDALTAAARATAPRVARFAVLGAGFAATIRVVRSATGVTEETRFLAPLDETSRVVETLARLSTIQRVLFASAFTTHCAPDASIPPVFVAPPSPVAVVLGPQVARRFSLDALASIVPFRKVGARSAATYIADFDGCGAEARRALVCAGLTLGGAQ